MILIIDFGGQYCHLIARKIRELGVNTEIRTHAITADQVRMYDPDGIILSGGPMSVNAKGALTLDPDILELNIPVLGICYGHQLLAKLTGGKVVRASKEYGKETFRAKKHKLFEGTENAEQVWMSHGDTVESLGEGFKQLGKTETCPVAAYADDKRQLYGVQFHPEVAHTPSGKQILVNFLKLCHAEKDHQEKNRADRLVTGVRELLNGDGVILGLSGGVDSLVAALIIQKATDNLHCVYVDHGLVRKNETEYVKKLAKEYGFKHFYAVDASTVFLKKLRGIVDPEQKRKIIGKTFVEEFEKKVNELKKKRGNITFLGQGTIYPDRIESAQPSGNASVIKTHHNVGGLPKRMKLSLVEPLSNYYKDEVREIGKELGIKDEHLNRHPFPGPGLAVRIVGPITEDNIRMVREADAIFTEALQTSGEYERVWQALAALLPVKSVGVMGDERTYDSMIALRAVTSEDAMTADWARLPYELLEEVSSRIIREVRGVNRVVYDISQKPPATIEYE